MNDQDILNQVKSVISLVFGVKDPIVTDKTVALDIDGWNSLSHMSFILQIETDFGITFNDEEMFKLEDIGDLINKIKLKLANK